MRVADANVRVEDVLAALRIVPVLTRGAWADALCPLHDEATPSFSVHLSHGCWVCRHGGQTGQLLDLVVIVRGGTRRGAADWVRGLASVPVATTAEVLAQLMPAWTAETDAGWAERYDELPRDRMSMYWFKRGFTAATMRQFDVRFDEEEDVLIWPVRDANANLLGFVKRVARDNPLPPKYLYPKGFERALFPLDHLVGRDVVLVEGSLDAMWVHQLGLPAALAVLGSDLTDGMRQWLCAEVDRVTLLFDNDRTGRLANYRVVRRLAAHLPVTVAALPAGVKDPQELPDKVTLDACLAQATTGVAFMLEANEEER